MKYLITFALICTTWCSSAQVTDTDFSKQVKDTSCVLKHPAGWGSEVFSIPISFAPEIKYSGIEEIRFFPGWGDPGSNEFWTYAFLWRLDGKIRTNCNILEKNLTTYFSGLLNVNSDSLQTANNSAKMVNVKMEELESTFQDQKSFSGKVEMPDYMTQKPICLLVKVHHYYDLSSDKTFIFYKTSIRPFSDPVWENLEKLWLDMCFTNTKNSY